MTRIIIFFILLAAGLPFPVQPGIDYNHKRILHELEKHFGVGSKMLEELAATDAESLAESRMGRFFTLKMTNYASTDHYIYIGRVNSCRAGGCSVSLDEEVYGDSEYFDYFILFDKAGVVELVRVFNYQATHGQEVSARGWLRQFEGYTGKGYLKVGKEIDAISGATISVYGITQDIVEKTRIMGRILGTETAKKIAGPGGGSD